MINVQPPAPQDAADEKLVRETLRYLGIRKASFDERPPEEQADLLGRIDDALRALAEASRPRFTCRTWPLVCGEGAVRFADTVLMSRDLARNLAGCTELCLFAATLGTEADRLIRRSAVRSAADAAIFQGAAAALTEEYVDRVYAAIAKDAGTRGLAAKPRFSPGFGDCTLDVQREFFRLLALPKTLGISLTDALLMIPEKSVTAFVGLYPREALPESQPGERCEEIKETL